MPLIADELKNVKEKYKILEVLGTGSFGTVRKCRNRQTGELFACKTIKKAEVENIESLRRELSILASVDHPHIIKFQDVYEDEKYIHLVTELCTGGELYDRVVEKAESDEGHFSEDDAAILVRDILDAIRYCHDVKHIVHRDLKPENFLLKDESDDAAIKVIDFGLSRKDDAPMGVMTSRVGTPYYVAPEVLLNEYTYKVDIWSIGVIAYILLCGFAPFSGDSDLDTLHLVRFGPLEFPSPEWDSISVEAIDFVTLLLDRDPLSRPTAAEAMQHPWIAKHIPVEPDIPKPVAFRSKSRSGSTSQDTSTIRLNSQRKVAFQKFLCSIKMKKTLDTVSEAMTPAEASFLGRLFRRVDKDRDGKIQLEDIDDAVENGNFSESVKGNLTKMRKILAKSPTLAGALNVQPFLDAVDEKCIEEPQTSRD